VFAGSPRLGYAWGALLGFLWLPSLAITLTIIERIAHKEHAGAASGIFLDDRQRGRPGADGFL
jgi:MFS transporter, FLVCR family, feline leukemia virus subgroup C receptor-related protein